VVLKCHLLLEEQLDLLLMSYFKRPKELELMRLNFEKKVRLAVGLTGQFAELHSRFLLGLNSLRNKLAHRLDGVDVEQQITELLKLADPESFEENQVARLQLRRKLRFLKQATVVNCGIFEGFHIGQRLAARRGPVA